MCHNCHVHHVALCQAICPSSKSATCHFVSTSKSANSVILHCVGATKITQFLMYLRCHKTSLSLGVGCTLICWYYTAVTCCMVLLLDAVPPVFYGYIPVTGVDSVIQVMVSLKGLNQGSCTSFSFFWKHITFHPEDDISSHWLVGSFKLKSSWSHRQITDPPLQSRWCNHLSSVQNVYIITLKWVSLSLRYRWTTESWPHELALLCCVLFERGVKEWYMLPVKKH